MVKEDRHHILWPKSRWSVGYAKALRCHNWLVVPVPRDTLHREIHREMQRGIQLPPGAECRELFETLCKLECKGYLDPMASLSERIEFLIKHLRHTGTIWGLEKQKEIVDSFYRSR